MLVTVQATTGFTTGGSAKSERMGGENGPGAGVGAVTVGHLGRFVVVCVCVCVCCFFLLFFGFVYGFSFSFLF